MPDKGIDRRNFMKDAMASGAGLGVWAAAGTAAQAQAAGGPAANKVPRKQLGTTGEDIPIILNGCNHKYDLKYDKRLHRAYGLGVDYIDTAQVYANGQSQKSIASFIKQIGDRKKLWITSKAMLDREGPTPERYKEELGNCLADLEIDYLDLFFMHNVAKESTLDAPFIKMGDELKKAGKTRYFGFSCHQDNVPALLNKAAKSGGFDAIMFRYNFRQYGDLELNKAIDACKKAGIGLIAMKTQGSVPADQKEVVAFQSQNFSLAQAKLKAVWADERIDAAVSQMENVQQIEENTAAAMSTVKLSMAEFVQLNRYAARTADGYCAGCNQICESRIGGELKVADALRHLMYYECYGDKKEEARALYNALAPGERDFEGIDLRAAAEACPQGIRIAQRLDEAKRVLSA